MVRHRPPWWDWESELSSHLIKRMLDRDFSEVDLRTTLEHSQDCKPDIVDGRWVIRAVHEKQTWEVVVEPDVDAERLVVITAYPRWES